MRDEFILAHLQKKLYYAHPIDIYNTPQEERDLMLMQKVFGIRYDIINPNSPKDEEAYKTKGMAYFTEQVERCDLLVFRAYPFGKIPAGVAKEIMAAIEKNIPVMELPSMVDRIMSVDDTRQYIKEVGTR